MTRPLRLVVGALLTTACGSSTRVESETHTTTVVQDLLDLQRAFESGVMTQNEYRRTKQDILHRYDC